MGDFQGEKTCENVNEKNTRKRYGSNYRRIGLVQST